MVVIFIARLALRGASSAKPAAVQSDAQCSLRLRYQCDNSFAAIRASRIALTREAPGSTPAALACEREIPRPTQRLVEVHVPVLDD